MTTADAQMQTSAIATPSSDDQSAIQQIESSYETQINDATTADAVTSLQKEATEKINLATAKLQAKAILAQDLQYVSSGTVYLSAAEKQAAVKQSAIQFETSIASQANYQATIQSAYQDALNYIDQYTGSADALTAELTSTNTSTGFANKIRTLYYPLIQAEYRNDNRYYAYTNMFNIYTLMGDSYLPNDRFSNILSTLDQVNEQVNVVPVSKGIQDTDYWPTMARSFAKSAIQGLVAQAESVSSQNKDQIENIANEYLAKLPSSD
ncbi:hypothetical protein [Fructobacillus parabroussonetiae]|uniref:Uncharacterized protein n=1 Tax=Fructobacillus parabroussonetiae TaxID=2713174 RepID=A0ABS5QYN2_9LACO|nr:hypothetical protein [Fructobacillus parabroussonetiae]MBS9337907.1 hypothetical protein [Fructobacillus parabroussonetiae]